MIQRQIFLRMADGSRSPATIVCNDCDSTHWLHLTGDSLDEDATGTDYFESFVAIRSRLARRQIFPLCYGASLNVWPSGMARDMGQGLAAYKMKMGSSAREQDLVNIFDDGPDIEPVTPEEQRAFSDAWYASLGQDNDKTGNSMTGIWRTIVGWFLILLFIVMNE